MTTTAGARMRAIREAQSITQGTLAAAVGVTRSTVKGFV